MLIFIQQSQKTINPQFSVNCMVQKDDDLIVGYDNGQINICYNYLISTPKFIQLTGKTHSGSVRCLTVTENIEMWGAKLIISGSLDQNIIVWNIDNQQRNNCLFELNGHQSQVNCVNYYQCYNEHYLASGSDDGEIKIWNLNQQRCIKTFQNHTDSINQMVIHAFQQYDNDFQFMYLISVSDDTSSSLYNLQSFEQIDSFISYKCPIQCLLINQKKQVVFGYSDQQVCIMNMDEIFFFRTLKIINYIYDPILYQTQNDDYIHKSIGYFQLTTLHVICYNQDIDAFKKYLQKLLEKKIYLHLVKDQFGKTVVDIIEKQEIWLTEMIYYYKSLGYKDFCHCCSKANYTLLKAGLKKEIDCISEFLSNKFFECSVVSDKTNFCGYFSKPIFLTHDKQYIQDQDIYNYLPAYEEGDIKQGFKSCQFLVEYVVKVINVQGILQINANPNQELLLKHICEYEVQNEIFQNQVLGYILEFKWQKYAKKIFLFQALFFYINLVLFLVNFAKTEIKVVTDSNIKQEIDYIIPGLLLLLNLINLIFHYKIMNHVGYQYYFSQVFNCFNVWNNILVFILMSLQFLQLPRKQLFRMTQSFTIISMSIQSLGYYRSFDSTSFFIRMLARVALDIKEFMIIMYQLMIGFALGFYILQEEIQISLPHVIKLYYLLSIGDYDNDIRSDSQYLQKSVYMQVYAFFIFFLATFILVIVMLNLLISIISDTYANVKDLKKNARNFELTHIIYVIEAYMPLPSCIKNRFNSQLKDFLIVIEKNYDEYKQTDIQIQDRFNNKIIQDQQLTLNQVSQLSTDCKQLNENVNELRNKIDSLSQILKKPKQLFG